MPLSDLTMLWKGSHEGSYNLNSGNESYQMYGPWEDRHNLVSELLNSYYSDLTNVQNSKITDSDSQPLKCNSVTFKNFGDVDSVDGGPEKAIFTASYKTLSSEVQRRGDVSNWKLNISFAGEAVTLGQVKKWEWDSTGKKLSPDDENVNAVKVLPHADVSVTGRWDTVNKTSVSETLGKINSGGFIGFGAHTLLFTGLDVQEEDTTTTDDYKYNITYHFSWKPNGWNSFWNQEENKFDTLKHAEGGGAFSYPYSDTSFSSLNPNSW